MKKLIILAMISICFSQSIEETLQQIGSLKKEIEANEKLVDEKIADLKRTNPLFFEQDVFESDLEYLGRMSRAMPQLDRLRKQYLDDLWHKMSILRGRMFETSDINVNLEKDRYDANTETWPITISHAGYQREVFDITLSVAKENARDLYKNWTKVQKTGILAVDVGDKIGLAKFGLKDPISGFEYEHEFRPMRKFNIGRIVKSVEFSPNGYFLASGGSNNGVNIYDLRTGQEVINIKNGKRRKVNSLSFSPDGKVLAFGDEYNAQVYDLESKSQKHVFSPGAVWDVDLNPDGKFLAVSGSKISLYNIETGNLVQELSLSGYVSYSVSFSPNGKYLAYGSSDNYAHIYDLEKDQNYRSFKTMDDIHSVSFSPDGEYLAVGSNDDHAYVFNIDGGNEVNKFSTGKNVYSVTFTPDGKNLIAGLLGSIYVYDLAMSMKGYQITSILPTGQAGSKAILAGDVITRYDSKVVDGLNLSQLTRATYESRTYELELIRDGNKKLTFSLHGGKIGVYGRDIRAKRVFNFQQTGKNIAISPDGKYIAAASDDNHAYVFRTLFQIEEEVLAQKSISLPPSLSASVSFREPSGNKFLDAMETGVIELTLENKGKGPGKGVLVKITPERTDDLNYNNTYIEEIPPGKSISVEISLEAYIGISDGDHTFRLNFEEVNGFPPDPVELQFSTKAYLNPEMYIVDVGIEDDNANGKIESGEMINIMLRVGNKGKGTAKSAYAKLYAGDNVFITEKHPKTVKMGDLVYNGSIDIPLEFFVNDKTVDDIPLYVDFTEENSLANVSKLRLPIKKSERARKIGRTVVKGIEQEYGELTLGADLSIDIEQDIPTIGKMNKNRIAIVIGNKNYSDPDVPEVTFAHRDAAVMEEYLTKMLGYKEVIVETDATQGKFNSLFGTEKKDGRINDIVRKGKSEIFIYYSGHGAPDPETKDGYFVPVDCDPAMVDVNGYSLDLFYEKINKLKAKSVTVVIDACFSGSSDKGALLKNISPVGIRVDDRGMLSDGVTVFTSSSGDQVSSWYPDKKHSLYTYFFLKGLLGEADMDGNSSVTVDEMQFYVTEEVGYQARNLNSREQTPGLQTNQKDRILVTF